MLYFEKFRRAIKKSLVFFMIPKKISKILNESVFIKNYGLCINNKSNLKVKKIFFKLKSKKQNIRKKTSTFYRKRKCRYYKHQIKTNSQNILYAIIAKIANPNSNQGKILNTNVQTIHNERCMKSFFFELRILISIFILKRHLLKIILHKIKEKKDHWKNNNKFGNLSKNSLFFKFPIENGLKSLFRGMNVTESPSIILD